MYIYIYIAYIYYTYYIYSVYTKYILGKIMNLNRNTWKIYKHMELKSNIYIVKIIKNNNIIITLFRNTRT